MAARSSESKRWKSLFGSRENRLSSLATVLFPFPFVASERSDNVTLSIDILRAQVSGG